MADVTGFARPRPPVPAPQPTDDVAPPAGADAGFRPSDPDLAGHVVLDFAAFDWFEEDERVVSHPRDPFHRIDVLRSSRQVRLELDGHVLAETNRARLLFETTLPMRFYLPPEDVRAELEPSPTRTLHDATDGQGLIAFFDERVDVVLDGQRRERPVTPWA